MAAACRCSQTSRYLLNTRGYVCPGHNGFNAHWLCQQCTGPRMSCRQHPQATVVPVRSLWAETRFDPKRACTVPTDPIALPELNATDVVVHTAGAYGFTMRVLKPLKTTTVVKLKLKGVAGYKYAVAWPTFDAVVYLFPRASFVASKQPLPTSKPTQIEVLSLKAWSAWTADATVLGLPPSYVQQIMTSSCARVRWWFIMPQTPPPLHVPLPVAMMTGIDEPRLSLGDDCDAPLRPYNSAWTLSPTNGHLTCAWCKSTNACKDDWLHRCAPDGKLLV